MKKISIIVPVYNVEEYIDKCLNTLVKQTIDDYEIIVIIDGSKDNSIEIVKKYKKEYPNLIKYYETENKGLSSARNLGLSKSTGEYVGFVDSDDYVSKNMFKDLYDYAKENKYNIVACDYLKIFKDKEQNIILDIKKEDSKKDKIIKSRPYACNKIFKRSIFKKYSIQFPEKLIFEDIYAIYTLMLNCNEIGYLNKTLYYYNFQRDGSIMNNKFRDDEKIFYILNLLNENAKKNKIYESNIDAIREINVRHIFYRLNEMKKYNTKKSNIKFLNKAFSYLDNNFKNWKKDSDYLKNIKYLKRIKLCWLVRIILWRK